MLLGLTSCGRTIVEKPPVIVHDPVEVPVETPVICPIDVPPTRGADFASRDSDILEAAIYAHNRIISLRAEINALRDGIKRCKERLDPERNAPQEDTSAPPSGEDGGGYN